MNTLSRLPGFLIDKQVCNEVRFGEAVRILLKAVRLMFLQTGINASEAPAQWQ